MMPRLLSLLATALLAAQAWAATLPIVPTHINGHALRLEAATTGEQREHGLMERKTLAPYDGMVFFFEKPKIQKFWMKNTYIPLDLLFVDEQNSIIFIAHGEPHNLTPVGPDTAITSVIEIRAGRAAKEGIKPGDKVTYDKKNLPAN